ncbi:MAG: hypothetical protein M0C28_31030 [Candidatus Moduliflexus flocculans]|nr:hypothetical protein [Candidatus Moduliflexus flocculans]
MQYRAAAAASPAASARSASTSSASTTCAPSMRCFERSRHRTRRFSFFIDDNIASDQKALAELCHALIPMKVSWISQASLDVTRNLPLMDLLQRAGELGQRDGLRSRSPRRACARPASRRTSRAFGRYKRARCASCATMACRAGPLSRWATTTTPPESIAATVDFALQSKFTFAAYNILMPYPEHTAVPQASEQEGRPALRRPAGGCIPSTASTAPPTCPRA